MNFDLFFHKNSWPRLTPIACAICVVIFVGLQFLGPNATYSEASRWGFLPDSAIWTGSPWALISSAFVHRQLLHFAFNVYWLWILGNLLEEEIGPLYWLLLLVTSAWVSSAFELFIGGSMGIGMSGVLYAFFGFGWIARRRMPRLGMVLNPQTIQTFLAWMGICVVLTYAGVMNVANVAHASGLVFGVVVASVFVLRQHLVLTVPGLALLAMSSFVPLAWCPLSSDWTAVQASNAFEREDWDNAEYWYHRGLALGENPVWAWSNLAIINARRDEGKYAQALRELEKINSEAAQEIEGRYGSPNLSSSAR